MVKFWVRSFPRTLNSSKPSLWMITEAWSSDWKLSEFHSGSYVAPVLSYRLYHQQHLACISSVWFWIHDYVLSIKRRWQILTIELCHFLDTKLQLIAPWLIDFQQLRRIEGARLAANPDHTEKTSSSSRTSGRNHCGDHLEAFDAIFVLLNLWLLLIFQ